jgi:hypothetical protein
MTLTRVPESIVFVHGSGFLEDYFVFRGPLVDINVALAGIVYTPDMNWNSNRGEGIDKDTIELRVIDGKTTPLFICRSVT